MWNRLNLETHPSFDCFLFAVWMIEPLGYHGRSMPYIYIYHKRFFFRCVGNEFTSNKKPVAKEPSKSPSPAWRNWRWRTQDIYLSVGSYNRFFVINGVMLKNMQEKTTQFNHRHFQGGLSSFLLSCFVFCTSFIPMFLKSQQENTHKCQQV